MVMVGEKDIVRILGILIWIGVFLGFFVPIMHGEPKCFTWGFIALWFKSFIETNCSVFITQGL